MAGIHTFHHPRALAGLRPGHVLVREAGVWVNETVGVTLFNTFGATSSDYHQMGAMERAQDVIAHLTLPTAALVLSGYAIYHRFQRATMLEVLNSDYIRLAKSKGVAAAVSRVGRPASSDAGAAR